MAVVAPFLFLAAAQPLGPGGTAAGAELSRRLGDTPAVVPGTVRPGPLVAGRDVSRPLGTIAPARAAVRPSDRPAGPGDRDAATACRRYWFGRTNEVRRIVAAGKDPCDLMR